MILFKIFIYYYFKFYLAALGLSCDMWDLFPDWGLNLGPLHWKCRVLATGPPGKSLLWFFDLKNQLWSTSLWQTGKKMVLDTFWLTNKITSQVSLPLTKEAKNQFQKLKLWLLLIRQAMTFLRLQGLCWFCFVMKLVTCHPVHHSRQCQNCLPGRQLC